MEVISANRAKLKGHPEFTEKILAALELMDKQQQVEFISHEQHVDSQLYDNFIDSADKSVMSAVRAATPDELDSFGPSLHDQRLKALLPLYKARNYPSTLSTEEREAWERFCMQRLTDGGQQSRLAKYFEKLQELAAAPGTTKNQQYALEELRLYGESIIPAEADEQ